MIERVAVAGADQRDLVGLRCDAGKQLGYLHAGLPVRWNFQGLPRMGAFAKSMRLVLRPFAISAEIVSPLRLASSGLGSKVSTWLTPPCMNRWMTALGARPENGAALGASGLRDAASNIGQRQRAEAASGLISRFASR